MKSPGCPICETPGGAMVWQGRRFRVIRAAEEGFPAFWRLVWTDHVPEFTDLVAPDRAACMEAVALIERAVRDVLAPTKVNIASLGNVVPHLHWHVIARFDWDSRFPAPVWAPSVREAPADRTASVVSLLPQADAAIAAALGG